MSLFLLFVVNRHAVAPNRVGALSAVSALYFLPRPVATEYTAHDPRLAAGGGKQEHKQQKERG